MYLRNNGHSPLFFLAVRTINIMKERKNKMTAEQFNKSLKMKTMELALKNELMESIKKLNNLCEKGGKIIEAIEKDEIEFYEGVIQYNDNIQKEKETLEYTVIIINNLFEKNFIDLAKANQFYNMLYEASESISNYEKKAKEWSE